MSGRADRGQRHASDGELLLQASGDLPRARAATVANHLETCPACRSRQASLESAVGDFARARRSALDRSVPPPAPAKARLADGISDAGENGLTLLRAVEGGLAIAASIAVILVATNGLWERSRDAGGPDRAAEVAAFTPDPELTPGLTNSSDRRELCAPGADLSTTPVRRAVALQIFRAHGIEDPPPFEYELDHLVPPELGGMTAVRNLWPQPYAGSVWNARAKDALEDRLIHLMCEGEVPLAAAQAEIAGNWVAAYKKYFGASEPLIEHAAFLKDEPWR